MSNPFIEQRLNIPFDFGGTYGPRFKTDANRQSDGSEQRSPRFIDPLIFIDLAQYSVNADEIEYLLSFHESVKGSGIGFRIKDWSDYLCPGYTLGTGNGTTQTWQLVKTYAIGSFSVKRVILKPVAGSVVLRKDGIIQNSGWSVNTTTGVITTNLTGVLSVDEFEFDIPVRFEQDKINFVFDAADNWGNKFFKMQALTCVEIRIKPQIYPPLDPPPDVLPQIQLGYDYGTTGGPKFETSIVQAGPEFEDRKSFWDTPLGEWNIGDRGLSRAEADYLIAFFRACRGRLVPFGFYDWQDETIKRVRFSEDTIRLRFDAYREGDRAIQFNLGGIGVKELKIDSCTPRSLSFSSNFSSDSWELAYLENYAGDYGEGTIAEAELSIVSGGNTGNCGRIQLDFGGVDNAGIIAFWKSSYYYVPSHPDEILSFVYSEDRKYISGTDSGHGWGFGVLQNGVFKFKYIGATGNSSSWVSVSETVTVADLDLEIIPFVPIYLGIMRTNQNELGVSGVRSNVALIDNWSVTVNVSCG